jgi:hypothetical protein
MLRRHLDDDVLVHNRLEVREAESQAMYAGRCEVWKHGKLSGGTWHEWDYALAYANVCAENELPTTLVDQALSPRLHKVLGGSPGRQALVRAAITTDVPVLPYTDDAGICWPVGTFIGWYWAQELSLAVENGVQVKPITAWRYRAAPWLSSWAQWCMAQVADDSTPEARIRGLAAKHWTRAVPGRSAMQYRAWEDKGDAWQPGVGYMPLLDLDTGKRGAALTLGHQRWEAWSKQWWDNALPQLLSSVMAHCRVRLWHALQTAGFEHVAYCDTDSVIVDGIGHQRLSEAIADGYLWSLRYKGPHNGLEVTAPQLVEGSTYRRLAGVPKGARRTGASTYVGDEWDGVTTSINRGHPGEVRVRQARIALSGIDTRRQHLPGGATAPFTVVNGVRQLPQEAAS